MKRLSTLTAGFALLLCSACSWSNPHGSQELPPIKRLSEPQGATVHIERLNWRMELPVNLPETVDEDEQITISRGTDLIYQGPLSDLPQASAGNYYVPKR